MMTDMMKGIKDVKDISASRRMDICKSYSGMGNMMSKVMTCKSPELKQGLMRAKMLCSAKPGSGSGGKKPYGSGSGGDKRPGSGSGSGGKPVVKPSPGLCKIGETQLGALLKGELSEASKMPEAELEKLCGIFAVFPEE